MAYTGMQCTSMLKTYSYHCVRLANIWLVALFHFMFLEGYQSMTDY